MKLGDLLKGIDIIEKGASLETEIGFIANDHRRVKANTVFVAINGTKRNGNDYIGEALKKGAVTIITDDTKRAMDNLPYVIVGDAREALSKMWSNFYRNPSNNIKTVAITGTNGKTSSAFFLFNICRHVGISCALISTIGCFINEKPIEIDGGGSVSDVAAAMTTPDPETLQYLYNKMKENCVEVAVIEASSHALAQKRLCGIEIEIGAFTNLSREHLDFHGNLDEYFYAKEELFKISKLGIVNIDDEYGKRLKEKYVNIYGFSTKEKTNFFANNIKLNSIGCEYSLIHGEDKIDIKTDIIGKFTVYNSLLAASCAMLLGIEKTAIVEGIKMTKEIKGRLERYENKNIYIDYAHTPEAMKNVIQSIRRIDGKKRLIVLFGCGGDRDSGKRAEMGRICSAYADYTVITSDNPRSEDPQKIIADILSGVDKSKEYIVIENRKEAIEKIAPCLKENEILLLLGKGHEEYEITKDGKRFFSEREVLDRVFSSDK